MNFNYINEQIINYRVRDYELADILKENDQILPSYLQSLLDTEWVSKYPFSAARLLRVLPSSHRKSNLGKKLQSAISTVPFLQEHRGAAEIASNFRIACHNGDAKLALLWLDRADFNTFGVKDVEAALYLKNSKVLQELIKLGVKLNRRYYLHDFLFNYQGDQKTLLDIAKILINNEVDIGPDWQFSTALHYAAAVGNLEVVKLIEERLGSMQHINDMGATAVHYACLNENEEVLEYLLDKGVCHDPLPTQDTLWTIACSGGTYRILETLHSRGFSHNSPNIFGATPSFLMLLNPKLSNPSSPLSEQIAKEMCSQDKGRTEEFIARKLLAHRYSLSGNSTLNGKSFMLEGFLDRLALSHLYNSTLSFYSRLQEDLASPQPNGPWTKLLSNLSQDTQSKLENAANSLPKVLSRTSAAILNSARLFDVSEQKKLHEKGEPTAIVVSWQEHCTTVVLKDNFIYRCNKGFGHPPGKPGIIRSEITYPERIKEALAFFPKVKNATDFNYSVVDILGLEDKFYIPQKKQKVGNCSVANTNSMEVAILHSLLEPLIGTECAAEAALAIKDGRAHDTRFENLRSYLNRHKTPQPWPIDKDLLHAIRTKDNLSNTIESERINDLINEFFVHTPEN